MDPLYFYIDIMTNKIFGNPFPFPAGGRSSLRTSSLVDLQPLIFLQRPEW